VTQPVTDRLERSTQLIIAHIVVLGRILHSFGTVHWVPCSLLNAHLRAVTCVKAWIFKDICFKSHGEMYRFLLYNNNNNNNIPSTSIIFK
jgi:hypothetical protein